MIETQYDRLCEIINNIKRYAAKNYYIANSSALDNGKLAEAQLLDYKFFFEQETETLADCLENVYKSNSKRINDGLLTSIITNIYNPIYLNNESILEIFTALNIIAISNCKEVNSGGKPKPHKPRKGSYESMTVAELKLRCAKRKIKYSGLNKGQLIVALRKK